MDKIFQTGVVSLSILALTGCSNLPGNEKQQGAAIGGATGAAVGAAVAKNNRVLGAVIGGAVGAAGGYVIGANKDKITGNDSNGAEDAAKKSESNPATPTEAKSATTADVNQDGFVTLDEVVAMDQAGLTDEQIVERLKATGQVFDLNEEQKRYLLEKGVSQTVIDQLPALNQEKKEDLLKTPTDSVIGHDKNTI